MSIEINVTGASVTATVSGGGGVPSSPEGISGAAAVTNIVSISQEDYDALAVKDATTVYIIT
jgi:hypothetical protein